MLDMTEIVEMIETWTDHDGTGLEVEVEIVEIEVEHAMADVTLAGTDVTIGDHLRWICERKKVIRFSFPN